jgi:hypothetical protein
MYWKWNFLAACVGTTMVVACQDYPFMFRPNQRVAITTVREVVIRNADTDILFVIDDSGSMREEQINLIKNTGLFIEALAESENMFQVGIITTNAADEDPNDQIPGALGQDGGRLRMQRATDPQLISPNPQFIPGVDLGLSIPCDNPPNRDPNTSGKYYLYRPDPNSANVDAERCHLIKDFMATVASLGTGGTGREAGLLAATKALDPSDAQIQARNAGFLREEADLALIFLTDEDDCSFADYCQNPDRGTCGWNNPTCYERIAQAMSIESFLDHLTSIKASTAGIRKVRAALIAGGTIAGDEAGAFTASGCRITGSQPSDECGCWTSSDQDFFCRYLESSFGHACGNDSVDGCTGRDESCPCSSPSYCDSATNRCVPTCKSTASASCDTLRCEAMPGKRYENFLEGLGERRIDVGFPRGTYADSICQPNYDETLLNIANTVVLSSCFTLEENVFDAKQVRLMLRHTDPSDGKVTQRRIPWWDASDSAADCNSCVDATCQTGAWKLNILSSGKQEICLHCDLKKDTGDDFQLTVLNEIVGFDDGGDP